MDPADAAHAADSGARSVGIAKLDAGAQPLAADAVDGAFPSSMVNDLSAEGRCLSGTYEGPVTPLLAPGMRPTESSGTIVLELSAISGQDQLWVTGEFIGVLQAGGLLPDEAPVVIKVRAVLDCATHQLKDGLLIRADGESETVVGMLQGNYSDKPASLSGSWFAGGLIFGSSGNWSASAQTNTKRAP